MTAFTRHLFCAALSLCCFAASLSAQDPLALPSERQDTILADMSAQIDSLLSQSGLWESLPCNVKVRQSSSILDSFNARVESNKASDLFTGFRIRIYHSGAQEARVESGRSLAEFHNLFPELSVYRSYSNPYFKVSVGDWRTRVDAEKALRAVRVSFPSATIVKEKMRYPVL